MPKKPKLSPEEAKAAIAKPLKGELIPKPLRTRAKGEKDYELSLNKRLLITPELIEDVQKHYSGGATLKQIAYALGVMPDTLADAIQKNPNLSRALHRGRLEQINKLSGKAFQLAMDGNVPMLIFLLKTIGRFSESWKSTTEGEDVPVPPVLTLGTSDPVEAMRTYERLMRDT